MKPAPQNKETSDNELKQSSFFEAARSGNKNVIETFLKEDFDLQARNSSGHSALMLAAYNGHYEASDLLISRGADVNSVDQSGNSILMGVVYKSHMPIFELLIQSGANLEYMNSKKQTALDYAIMFGRRNFIFKINQLLNSNRSDGRFEQVKTWVGYLKP